MEAKVYLSYPFFGADYNLKYYYATRADLVARYYAFIKSAGIFAIDKHVEKAIATFDRTAIPVIPKCVAYCGGLSSFRELDAVLLDARRPGGLPFFLLDGDGLLNHAAECEHMLDSIQYCAFRECSKYRRGKSYHPLVKVSAKDFIFNLMYRIYDSLTYKLLAFGGDEEIIRLVVPVPTALFEEINADFQIMANHYISNTSPLSDAPKKTVLRDVGISFYPFYETDGGFIFDTSSRYNRHHLKSVYGTVLQKGLPHS